MPNKKTAFPAARVKDPISVGLSIIVGGEDTVLIGGAPKPIACTDCKANELLNKGNPVNTSSGAKVQPSEIDFSLPAPLPFAMERFYASDTPFTGLLGQGWRTGLELHCDADATRTRLVDIQGRWIDFAPLDAGEEQSCPSEGVRIARGTMDKSIPWEERWQWLPEACRHDPNLLIVTSGNGDYWLFEAVVKPVPGKDDPHPLATGRYDLVTLVTRHGYTTQLRWRSMHNAAGLAVRVPEFVTDSAGRIVRMHCSALPEEHKRQWSNCHPDTDAGIRLSGVSLAYDPQRDANAPADLAALRDLRVTEWLVRYHYSDAGDLIEVQDGDGDTVVEYAYEQHLMTQKRTPDGRDARYEYDRYEVGGKVIRHTQAGALDYRFVYGEHDTTVTDSFGRTTVYRFEGQAGLRRPVAVHHPDGGIVQMAYTNDGQLKRLTDPLGRITHFKHTSGGDFLGSVNPLGHRQERYLDAATGLTTGMRDGEGQSIHIDRDARGNPTRITGPDGRTTRYEYGHPHYPDRPSVLVDAKGGKKHLAYNALGQLSRYTDCSGHATGYTYDSKGRLHAIEYADGSRQSYQRDKKGRISAVILPGGKSEAFHYDQAGRLIKAIDTEGRPVEMTYDRQGRITEHRVWLGPKDASGNASGNTSSTGPDWSLTRYDYDPAGRLVKLTNAAGVPMGFGYDAMDRLSTEIGFDGKRSTYGYNLAGELIALSEANGSGDTVAIRHEHDAGGRLIARHIPASNGSPEQIHRFTYNKRNQLIQATTYNSRTDFAYNLAGQLIAETQSSMDGFSQTLRYGYDELGNRNQLILPDGQTVDTLLYGSGHWHQVAFNGQPLVDVERDSLHREISRTLSSGSPQRVTHPLNRTQSYTALGQLGTTAWHKGSTLIEQRRHQYSQAGLLTQIDCELEGLRCLTRYAYDHQERLTAWDVHAVTTENGQTQYRELHKDNWAHDPAGNPMAVGATRRIDPVSGVAHYVTAEQWETQVKANLDNPGFNLLGQNSPRPNRTGQIGDVFYRYDERGNVVNQQGKDGERSFAWNALNQMTASSFQPADSKEVMVAGAYYHDAFGRRIAKIVIDMRKLRYDSQGEPVPGTLIQTMTRYVWDGDRLLQEITDGHVKTIVYEPNSFVPLAQVVRERSPNQPALTGEEQHSLTMLLSGSGLTREVKQALLAQLNVNPSEPTMHLFLTDHLGTPYRMVKAVTHEVVWEREQGPWGETLKETVNDTLPQECVPALRFQGQQFDWETGLHYNRYRHYDSGTQRYLSQDPIKLEGGLNYYAYPTNPVQETDPIGLQAITVFPGSYEGARAAPKPSCANRIAAAAQKLNNQKKYSYDSEYGPGTKKNKCNMFVSDVIEEAGLNAPTRTNAYGLPTFQPLEAGKWADPKVDISGFEVVQSPMPGDIVAVSHRYANATGHVAVYTGSGNTIGAGGGGSHTTGWPQDPSTSPQGTPVYRRCKD